MSDRADPESEKEVSAEPALLSVTPRIQMSDAQFRALAIVGAAFWLLTFYKFRCLSVGWEMIRAAMFTVWPTAFFLILSMSTTSAALRYYFRVLLVIAAATMLLGGCHVGPKGGKLEKTIMVGKHRLEQYSFWQFNASPTEETWQIDRPFPGIETYKCLFSVDVDPIKVIDDHTIDVTRDGGKYGRTVNLDQ